MFYLVQKLRSTILSQYFMKIPSLSMCTYFIIITLCNLNPFGLWDVYCTSKNGDDSVIFFFSIKYYKYDLAH